MTALRVPALGDTSQHRRAGHERRRRYVTGITRDPGKPVAIDQRCEPEDRDREIGDGGELGEVGVAEQQIFEQIILRCRRRLLGVARTPAAHIIDEIAQDRATITGDGRFVCADLAGAMRQRASAIEMIARLDMTSFRNSIGPRWVAGERSLAQYGFTERSAFDDGWVYAKMADGSWQFGIVVLTDGQTTKRLCVTDDATGSGTYHATIPIEVSRQADGTWRSIRVFARLPGCVST